LDLNCPPCGIPSFSLSINGRRILSDSRSSTAFHLIKPGTKMSFFNNSMLPRELMSQILSYLTPTDLMNCRLARVCEPKATFQLFQNLRVLSGSPRRPRVLQILQHPTLAARIISIEFESSTTAAPSLMQLVVACGNRRPSNIILRLDRADLSYFVSGDPALINWASQAGVVKLISYN
jgi:hypothetical protein